MSTLTTTPEALTSFFVTGVDLGSDQYAKSGTGNVNAIKIFKAGTFKDSLGVQRTWEIEHLEQLIFHYNLLKDQGKFTRVPLRDGHPSLFGGGGSVIGEITKVWREDSFLMGDLNITEPDALAKWKRGTFGPRSLEISMYETNDAAEYWPVIMGLAFVDIPAVEGLHGKATSVSPEASKYHYFQTLTKELPVNFNSPNGGTGGTGGGSGDQGGGGQQAPAGGGGQQQQAPVQQGGGDVPVQGGGSQQQQQYERPAGTPAATFSIGGQVTSDFAAVQRHIDNLETVIRETTEATRDEYVSNLASSNRIMASEVSDLQAFARTLTAEQYTAWKKQFDGRQPNPLFNKNGNDATTGDPNSGGGVTDPNAGDRRSVVDHFGSREHYENRDDEISVLEERLAMHRRTGMSEETIAKTESFRRLQTLRNAS